MSAPEHRALISVAIYIWGDNLALDRINDVLGVKPTLARAKGEVRMIAGGRQVTAPTGVWVLDTDEFVPEGDVGARVAYLASVVKCDVSRSLRDLKAYDACIDVYLPVPKDIDGYTFHHELSPEAIEAARKVGLPIRFSIALPIVAQTTD